MDQKTETTEGAEQILAGFPFFGLNSQAMRWTLWPMEFWFHWQADVLKTATPAAAEWMTRRREGAEAALQALERLCACHDAREVSKIQTEWVEDEQKRLEQDMRALGTTFAWASEFAKASSRLTRPEAASR